MALGVNPLGCKQDVLNQIDYVKSNGTYEGPKKVLIIGASSSYGLATRINLAFGAGADTIGISFEKGPKTKEILEQLVGTITLLLEKKLKKKA